MPRFTLAASLLLCTVTAVAQKSPTSDPLAVSLAQQSMTALNGGAAISDVTLTGNANWIAGSDNETGQLTLRAKSIAASRIDLTLSGGTRTEIRNDAAGFPQGESIRPDGTVHPWAPTIAGSTQVGFSLHYRSCLQLPIPPLSFPMWGWRPIGKQQSSIFASSGILPGRNLRTSV